MRDDKRGSHGSRDRASAGRIPLSLCRHVLRTAPHPGPRQGHVPHRRPGHRLPGLLRWHPHRQRGPLQRRGEPGHHRPERDPAAHLDPVPHRAPGRAGREDRRDHPGASSEELLHLLGHRGQRDRRVPGPARHRTLRHRRPAPRLFRTQRGDSQHHRARSLADHAQCHPLHQARPQSLLLPLQPGAHLPLLRPALRARRGGTHPDDDHGRDRRVHGRAHPGRGRLHHPAQGVLPGSPCHRPQVRRPVHLRRGADGLGAHRRPPGAASSTGACNRTS